MFGSTIYEQRSSGLIAPVQPKPPPPEHPVRQYIRDKLKELAELLDHHEQTTHGCLGPFNIEAVASALEDCYRDPKAYTISTLAQHIRGLLKVSNSRPSRSTEP